VSAISLVTLLVHRFLARLLDLLRAGLRRDYVLAFDARVARGRETLVAYARPSVVFRPNRLFIPSGVARNFLVTSVKVGARELLSPRGATPAVAFGKLPRGARLGTCVALPTQVVSVTVVNQSDDDHDFQCSVCGPAF
jgi:hypothetical protein